MSIFTAMPRKLTAVLVVFIICVTTARASDTISRYRFFFASGGYSNNYKHPTQNYRTGIAINVGMQAVRQGKSGWGVEYGVFYSQGWYYSFLIPSTTLTNAYYRRYTETYLSFPLYVRKLFLRGSRHYYISFGPEFNLGLVEGQTDIDGNDEALWIFPESAGQQPSLFSAQLSAGCDFKGQRGRYFRLGFIARTGIAPLNVANYGVSSIPFTFGLMTSFAFNPEKQEEKRARNATD